MRPSALSLLFFSAMVGGCAPGAPSGSDGTDAPDTSDGVEASTLLIFHNNTGPMCLVALEWLDEMAPQYPWLVVEERLVFDEADRDLLDELQARHGQSRGVSTSFEYLPIVFFRDEAFSGFDDGVAAAIGGLLDSTE